MSILDIRVLGDPVLQTPADPVVDFGGKLKKFVADLFDTMAAAGGIGLAAPQVGRSQRVAVIDVNGVKRALVNPEIVFSAGSEKDKEGCLSIPEVDGEVERPYSVRVRAFDESGTPFELSAIGLVARCIQHEIDHLDGVLFIDHLSNLRRHMALTKWRRLRDNYPDCRRVIDTATVTNRHAHETEM